MDNIELSCQTKLAFETQKDANVAAVVAELQHATKLKTYRCKQCQLWHLASVG